MKRTNNFLTSDEQLKINGDKPHRLNFAASKGKQGDAVVWSISCPLWLLAQFFEPDDHQNTLLRAQRLVNEKRAGKITNYILSNTRDYIIPALTASIEDDIPNLKLKKYEKCMVTDFDFKTCDYDQSPDSYCGDDPIYGGLTVLSVPTTSRFYFSDGQHRSTGIKGLIAASARAGLDLQSMMPDDTVTIMLQMDRGLDVRQRHFSIQNSTAAKTNGSLNAIYAKKEAAAGSVARIIRQVFINENKNKNWSIDYEKTTCSGRNPNLFAYKTLVDSSFKMLGIKPEDEITKDEEDKLYIFWDSFLNKNKQLMRFYEFNSLMLREEIILPHSVFISGYASLCNELLKHENIKDNEHLQSVIIEMFDNVSLDRNDQAWIMGCQVAGKLTKNTKTINNVRNHLVKYLK